MRTILQIIWVPASASPSTSWVTWANPRISLSLSFCICDARIIGDTTDIGRRGPLIRVASKELCSRTGHLDGGPYVRVVLIITISAGDAPPPLPGRLWPRPVSRPPPLQPPPPVNGILSLPGGSKASSAGLSHRSIASYKSAGTHGCADEGRGV